MSLTSAQQDLLNKYRLSQQPFDNSDVNKYGSAYANLVASNPYATLDYRHSPWQMMLENLGFRTNYDSYKESLALQAREYDAAIAQKAYNEQYDSPAAQVARQRAAGLNPDLNGNVDSGSSADLPADDGNPPIPPQSEVDHIGQFVNTVFGLFSSAVGLSKDFLSLAQMRNSVESGNIGNSAALLDFAMKNAVSFIPEQYPEGDPDWANRASDLAYDSSASFLSKKQLKSFRGMLNSFFTSAPASAEQWKTWREQAQNRKGWFIDTSSDTYSQWDDVMRIIADNITEYTDKIFYQGLYNERKSSENTGEYLDSIDPSLQADVENATNRRNLASNHIDAILNEALDSIISDLRDHSESNRRGHAAAGIALVLFSLFRMISVSRTSGIQNGKPVNTTSFGF